MSDEPKTKIPDERALALIPLIPGTNQTDRKKVRELYDNSPNVEWSPFCQSMGWDFNITRGALPVARWVREKRYRLAKEHAEKLADAFARIKPKINEDILQTLRDYPQAHDEFLKTAKALHNALIAEINDHSRMVAAARSINQPAPPMRKGLISEFNTLSMSLTMLTQSKHRSLLLSEVSLRAVEERTEGEIIAQPSTATTAEKLMDSMKFEVVGADNYTSKDFQKLFDDILDKNQVQVLPPVVTGEQT